jgi:hypothetical protein
MSNQDRTVPPSGTDSSEPLIPWTTPVLHELGDLRTLTRVVDTAGRNDGGSGQMKRT